MKRARPSTADSQPSALRRGGARRRLLQMGLTTLICAAGGEAFAREAGRIVRAALHSSAAERRALIIGNARYPGSPLRNPVNDARLIASTAGAIGFQVALHENASRAEMLQGLSDFLEDADTAQVRLLYFAGHGACFRGRNFLLPVDVQIGPEEELPARAIDLQDITARLSRCSSGVNLLVFDACRTAAEVPGSRAQLRSLDGTRPVPRGSAPMIPPQGTLVVFSTAPDQPALDGAAGACGPFARHLAAEMTRIGVPIEVMLKRVRMAVMRETGNRQVPWDSSSLAGEFCLAEFTGDPVRP